MRRALEGDPVGGGSSQRWCRERAALRQPPASTPGTRGCHRAGPAGDRDLAPGCHSTLQSWVSLPCSGHLSHFLSIQEPWSCCACSWGSSAGPRGLAECWGWKVAVAPGGRVPSGCQTSSHGAQPQAAAGACPSARPARAVLAAGARCRAPGEQPGTRQVWLLRLPLAKVLGLQHFVMIFISSPSSDPSLLTLPK